MAASASPGEGGGTEKSSDGRYECNICLEAATDAVVSMCGHLFCWPCIHRWMESKPGNPTCPVCKSKIEKERLIPLYGRGATDTSDPREKIPPRPPGQREEPSQQNHAGTDGIQFSFGIGALPFAMMGGPMLQFGNGPRGQQQPNMTPQEREQHQKMAALFTTMAVLFLILLIFS